MREESGLTDVRVVGFLGRYLYDAAPYRDEVHDRYVYHLELTGRRSSPGSTTRPTLATAARPSLSVSSG